MDEIDRSIKKKLGKLKRSGSDRKKTTCPEEQTLSQYINGALDTIEKEVMEEHLLECRHCIDLVLIYKQTADDDREENTTETPKEWVAWAMNILQARKAKKGLADIVIRVAKEFIEIIENRGDLPVSYSAGAVPLRSGDKGRTAHFIAISKKFDDEVADVEIERVGDDMVNMKILTKNIGTGKPGEDMRISLFNPRRELASYAAGQGEAYFEGLTIGQYYVKITKSGQEVGELSLVIKE